MATVQTRPIINSVSAVLSRSAGLFAGYSVRETDGARAVVRFRDGDDTTDQRNILLTISLAPLESTRDWFMPSGIPYFTALYVEVVSGHVEGAAQISIGG